MMRQLTKVSTFLVFLVFTLAVQADTVRTTIVKETDIDSPIEDVFDYATTASHWSEWHPNTFTTRGADDHSATENERIVETLKFGQLRGPKLYWTVAEHVVPNKWRLMGRDLFGLMHFDLIYTMSVNEDGTTHFRREMIYDMDVDLLGKLNHLAFKMYNQIISGIALNRLKAVIEAENTD